MLLGCQPICFFCNLQTMPWKSPTCDHSAPRRFYPADFVDDKFYGPKDDWFHTLASLRPLVVEKQLRFPTDTESCLRRIVSGKLSIGETLTNIVHHAWSECCSLPRCRRPPVERGLVQQKSWFRVNSLHLFSVEVQQKHSGRTVMVVGDKTGINNPLVDCLKKIYNRRHNIDACSHNSTSVFLTRKHWKPAFWQVRHGPWTDNRHTDGVQTWLDWCSMTVVPTFPLQTIREKWFALDSASHKWGYNNRNVMVHKIVITAKSIQK